MHAAIPSNQYKCWSEILCTIASDYYFYVKYVLFLLGQCDLNVAKMCLAYLGNLSAVLSLQIYVVYTICGSVVHF